MRYLDLTGLPSLRLLLKHRGYTAIATLGLSVGLAVCFLLLAFARYSFSYNSNVPDPDDVYVVKSRRNADLGAPWSDHAPVLLREAAAKAPGVVAATGYLTWWPLTLTVNGIPRRVRSLAALPGFAQMLGLKALRGNLEEALSRPDAVAITEAGAKRLFGSTDVLGRAITLRSVDDGTPGNPPNVGIVRIAALIPTPPANTTISYEVIHGPHLAVVASWMAEEAETGSLGFPGNILVRVRPNASLNTVTEVLQHAVDQAPALQKIPAEMKARLGKRKAIDIKLSSLRDAYFDHEATADFLSVQVDRGDINVVRGLSLMGILVLLLAATNYVNLTSTRMIRRQHEIAVRKVLGANQGTLARQLLAESLFVAMLATIIGLMLAKFFLPVLGKLVARDLASAMSVENVAAALCIGAVLGVCTAIHPVWSAMKVRPASVLAQRANSESLQSARLRRILSIAQVSVAIGLASYALAIYWQARYALNASPGFNPTPLLVLDFPDAITFRKSENAAHFMSALSQQRSIAGVAVSNDPVGRSNNSWSATINREGGQSVPMEVKLVSAAFFEHYALTPESGRLFSARLDREEDSEPTVINSIAARQLGFPSPQFAVGKVLLFRDPQPGVTGVVAKRIVGIAPEIHYGSLRDAPRAIAYVLWLGDVTLTVRASGTIAEASLSVRRLWSQYFPNSELEIASAKEVYAKNYADDARLASLLALGTLVTMLIAAFGAYGLATDTVQRRTSEIVLHKLFGARRADIARLIAFEFAFLVSVATAVALPLSWFAIDRYLAPFSQHSSIVYWALAIAPLSAVAVVALSAAHQVTLATTIKPAQVLRNS